MEIRIALMITLTPRITPTAAKTAKIPAKEIGMMVAALANPAVATYAKSILLKIKELEAV
jgi:hypothetical protein